MLSQFWTCGIPLIVLLCWLSVNDAVPFGPHPEEESHSSESTRKTTHIVEHPRGATGTTKSTANPLTKLSNTKKKNLNINHNVNVNNIHDGPHTLSQNVLKPPKKQRLKNNREDINVAVSDSNEKSNSIDKSPADSVPTTQDLQHKKIPVEENESPEKCVNEVRKKDQIYTRSFPLNISSIDLDEEFKIAGEAEAKKTSSIHIGEDIALCWIETTTIKEDPAFDPPKRLVLREFTISFENSATIPDKYLECDKVEGEIVTGDEETVRKTSLHEIIDENTRRSRVVNFTSVSHIGPVVVTQHKKVRCGVGAVVSKDIYEWPDGTDNPKKRVEIKVGPSVRDLSSKNDEKSGECVTNNVPNSSEVDKTGSPASDCGPGESCDILTPCKEGEDCNKPSKVSSCEGDDCSAKNSSKGSVTTTEAPDDDDDDDVLAAGVTRRAATKEPNGILTLEESSTPIPNESVRGNNDSCSEDDIDCLSGKSKVRPKANDGISGKTSDDPEDIATGSTGEPCEKGSANCICTGSSCTIHRSDEPIRPETENKQDSSGLNSGDDPEEIANGSSGEPCEKGSANCFCTGSSCSIHRSDEPKRPEVGNKPDSSGSNNSDDPEEIVTGSSSEPCEKGSVNCVCTGSSCTIQRSDEPKRPEIGNKQDGNTSRCDSSESDCVTESSENIDVSDDEPLEKDENSSPMNSTETPVIAKETSKPPRQDLDGVEASSSCDESADDANCKPTDSSNDSNPTSESVDDMNLSTSSEFDDEAISASSESEEDDDTNGNVNININDNTNTNTFNDAVPSMPPKRGDKRTSKIKTTSELPGSAIHSTPSDLESTECASGSESTDCKQETTPSSEDNETITPLNEDRTLSAESCESSGSCESTIETLDSTETNEMAPTLTNNTKEPGESTCEDGSSDSDCISKSSSQASKPCDSTSGSCSEESKTSTAELVESITTTTEATSKELEYSSSTTMANVSTTAETRRNTPQISSLTPSPNKTHHRLALRVKVLLEHINENKEKEKLVQVEKHLMLNENPNEQGNHTLLWKIKSLNNTMNMETLKAIFNCSDFEKLSDSVTNLTESGQDKRIRVSLNENSEDRWDEGSSRKKREATTTTEATTTQENITISQNVTEESIGTDKNTTEKNVVTNKNITEQNFEKSANLTKDHSVKNENTTEANIEKDNKNTVKIEGEQDKNIAKEIFEKTKNITEAKATAIKESLPGVEEDIKTGLDHVLSKISKGLDAPAKSGVEKAAASSSSILKILASPADGRIHFRRRRRTENLGGVVAVDALKNPVKGEEIDRWSTERLVAAADGSKVRAVTEFKLLRDAVEDSQRIPIGT